MRSLSDLHGYQFAAVSFAQAHPRCALYLGLGLGKTIIALTVIAIETALGLRKRTLVIAPLLVANSVWKKEAANWRHTRRLRIQIATGTAEERLRALTTPADVYVINVENVQWLIKHFPRSKWHWDAVVLDESQMFKSPSTRRFKALRAAAVNKLVRRDKKLVTLRSPVKRMMLLSATPATNGLDGLWSQMALIDGGYRLGRSFQSFMNQYFYIPQGGGRYAKPRPHAHAKEQIYDKLRDRVYVLLTRDHLEMPELVSNAIEVSIPPRARRQYRELEREFLLELDTAEEPAEIIADDAAQLSNKLLQFCNGAVYHTPRPGEEHLPRQWSVVHEAKIEALRELVRVAEGAENLLVAYYYQTDLERLRRAFPEAVVLDKAGSQIDAWNRGEIPLLLAQPTSAGKGLNLQRGGATCVFFSLLWNLEAYQQFIGRLYRQGQSRTVTVNHLIIEDSIEQRVISALNSKAETQAEFLRNLKEQEIIGEQLKLTGT